MRELWLVLVPTWARADGLFGTPGMSPALNYKAYSNCSLATYPFFSSSKLLLYASPTIYLLSALSHVPTCWSVPYPCTFHLYFGLGSVRLPLTFWAHGSLLHWHFLLLLRPLSALPQNLPSPFSVIVLSSQYLFQRGPIWTQCEVQRFEYIPYYVLHGTCYWSKLQVDSFVYSDILHSSRVLYMY